VARNQELVGTAAAIADGDEVALIPPVSGGSGGEVAATTTLAEVREAAIDLMEVVRAVAHEGAGGVVTFTGLVRRESRGRTIERLEYEAYKVMAEGRLAAIAREIAASAPGVRVAILHRVGVLAVGEVAVVIAASAPHRAEAFAAAREAIERLKREVPIWKKEVAIDGEEWIGTGP
jgi:molybdopterin synthase catalytic subunit